MYQTKIEFASIVELFLVLQFNKYSSNCDHQSEIESDTQTRRMPLVEVGILDITYLLVLSMF